MWEPNVHPQIRILITLPALGLVAGVVVNTLLDLGVRLSGRALVYLMAGPGSILVSGKKIRLNKLIYINHLEQALCGGMCL